MLIYIIYSLESNIRASFISFPPWGHQADRAVWSQDPIFDSSLHAWQKTRGFPKDYTLKATHLDITLSTHMATKLRLRQHAMSEIACLVLPKQSNTSHYRSMISNFNCWLHSILFWFETATPKPHVRSTGLVGPPGPWMLSVRHRSWGTLEGDD